MEVLYNASNESKDISEILSIIASQLRALQQERDRDKISLGKFKDERQALEVMHRVFGTFEGFLYSLFLQAPSTQLLISALICHQWAIEEAQSGLQLKDEVIQQVGAELGRSRILDCFGLPQYKYYNFLCFYCLYIFFMCLRQKDQLLRHAEETKEEFLSTIKVKVTRMIKALKLVSLHMGFLTEVLNWGSN